MLKALVLLIFWLLVAIAAVVAVVWFFSRLWHRYYLIERKPTETHWIRTLDGWRIAVHRFVPKRKTKRTPVLLCHGMGGNSLIWNFSDSNSLAKYLNQRGFEVWAVDLRGAGMSTKPSVFGHFKYDYDFYDYLERDLYEAVEHIKRTSKAKRIHFVGHSMGGMLAYAYISGQRKDDISRAAVLGTPGSLDWINMFSKLMPLVKALPYLPFAPLARAAAPLFEPFPALGKLIGANVENLERRYVVYQAANLSERVPSLLIKQFMGCRRKVRELLSDGANWEKIRSVPDNYRLKTLRFYYLFD